MNCANKGCRWLGRDGGCRLFAGAAAGECNYRVEPGRPRGDAKPTRKGKK